MVEHERVAGWVGEAGHVADAAVERLARERHPSRLEGGPATRPGQSRRWRCSNGIVTAHGYVTLHRDGFFASRNATVQTIAERTTQVSRALLRGKGTDSPT